VKRRLLLLAALPLHARAALNFPADFGAHPGQGIEWWYLTGLLGEAGGPPRLGYQLTFFSLPGPAPANHPSPLAARQLMLGHVALSDLGARKQRHSQRLLRALPGVAHTQRGDCDVKLRDWTLKRTPDGYRAVFNGPGFAMQLQLTTPEPPLQQGDGGLSRKGADPKQFSHYYSRPQLATQAALTLDGRTLRLAGRSWLDHEWSDNYLGATAGWDWLGINLDDGRALTLFQLRRADGSRDWAGGSLRTPGRPDRSFAADEVAMTPLRHWTSPVTGGRWPVEWRLRSPAGELRLVAAFDEQEVDARRSSGLVYWEGVAWLLDGSGRQIGAGYLELTGYVGRPPLV
jgi:predicted secreted hydrolase